MGQGDRRTGPRAAFMEEQVDVEGAGAVAFRGADPPQPPLDGECPAEQCVGVQRAGDGHAKIQEARLLDEAHRVGIHGGGYREDAAFGRCVESSDSPGQMFRPVAEIAAQPKKVLPRGSAHTRSRRILTEIESNSAATGANGLLTSTVTAWTHGKVPRIRAAICWAKVSIR